VLRAKEASTDMRASIDLLVDKLERQVSRYREKRQRRGHRHGDHRNDDGHGGAEAGTYTMTNEEGGPVIVKTKQFAMKPMSAEEAVLQLELVGHDFFVFRNEETDQINVVYRRQGGGYGLIEPQ
jgi:putative sigma-54 modulation protein